MKNLVEAEKLKIKILSFQLSKEFWKNKPYSEEHECAIMVNFGDRTFLTEKLHFNHEIGKCTDKNLFSLGEGIDSVFL